jgi:hypothetical protein
MALTDGINKAPGAAPGTATVAVTTTEIVPEKTNRQWVFITNTGAEDVFIAIGQDAVLSKGLVLRSPNGSLVLDTSSCPTGAVNGIVAANTSAVIFQESA